ncbi:ferredoxin [candidate division WWE3 bacterium CG_4_10_14_0_2_um_filter_42_7]|uniref:Ferredoxin n=2 Tax=Katanobacteria TaxID=422282 RepID=A0A2H0X8K6_UNCKA|nr:MAG: ferredoxin [candidate division WWE3 bacterium CG08_land_8_20_14_0_20_41_15]PIZ44161.1 MAG: ferredoxin [candidate division WWE3 bacterium CG_4_10_14_0_2_um_filter_42_7]
MIVKVNKNLCIGCGLCTQIAPKSFKLGEDGKSEGINPPGDSEEKLNEAKDSCPVSAISLE